MRTSWALEHGTICKLLYQAKLGNPGAKHSFLLCLNTARVAEAGHPTPATSRNLRVRRHEARSPDRFAKRIQPRLTVA